jgi:hypothetical protein
VLGTLIICDKISEFFRMGNLLTSWKTFISWTGGRIEKEKCIVFTG